MTSIIMVICGIFLIQILRKPAPEQFNTSNQLRIIAHHPELASAARTDKEVTAVLENLLVSMPEVKSVHSHTQPGNATITVTLDVKETKVFQAALQRKIRLNKSRLPSAFTLPQIAASSIFRPLVLPDSIVNRRKQLDSVQNVFSASGSRLLIVPFRKAQESQSDNYRFFTDKALWRPSEIQLNGWRLSLTEWGWYADSVLRTPQTVSSVLLPPQEPVIIRNGINHRRIEYAGKANPFPVLNNQKIHQLPVIRGWMVLSIILLIPILYHQYRQRNLVKAIPFIVLSTILLCLFESDIFPSHRGLILACLFYTSFMLSISSFSRKPRGPVLVVFLFLLVVPGIRKSDFRISSGEYKRSMPSDHALESFIIIHSQTSEKDKRELRRSICNALGQNQLNYEMEMLTSHTLSIKVKDSSKARSILSTLALNSAGTYWFISTSGKTILSTFKSPLYPSVQWTLSGFDLRLLQLAADSLKEILTKTPNVHHITEVHTSFGQLPTTEYLIRGHPDPQQFNRYLVSLTPGPKGHFQGVSDDHQASGLDALLIPSGSSQSAIFKRDRQYYLQIGHEYAGSDKAQKRFRQRLTEKLLNTFGDHISINPWNPPDRIMPQGSIAAISIALFFTFIISAFRGRDVQDVIHQGVVVTGFVLLHSIFRISMWEPRNFMLLILTLNYVLNLYLSINILTALASTVLMVGLGVFVQIESIIIGQTALVCGAILTRLELKSFSGGFSLLPPWRGLRFFQRS